MKLQGLYAITPELADNDDLLRRVTLALEGGARFVQYRNKQAAASPVLALQQAQRLLARCHEFDAKLIINDNLKLALEIGADGVHLGREDGDLAAARQALGADKILGVSCYKELDRAREAQRCGADYIAFGSFFNSTTKPAALRAPIEILQLAKHEFGSLNLAIVAIGGITLENAPSLINAGAGSGARSGADAVAVISDLFDAPDIRARAAAFSKLFE